MIDPTETNKITKKICQELGLNPDEIHVKIPTEFSSANEATKTIKTILLKEMSADINNKLTLPLTILNKLAEGQNVSTKHVDFSIRELEAAIELFRKIKNQIEEI